MHHNKPIQPSEVQIIINIEDNVFKPMAKEDATSNHFWLEKENEILEFKR